VRSQASGARSQKSNYAGHFSPCEAKNDLRKNAKYHAAAGESYLLHPLKDKRFQPSRNDSIILRVSKHRETSVKSVIAYLRHICVGRKDSRVLNVEA
jgi:hypothetical protein